MFGGSVASSSSSDAGETHERDGAGGGYHDEILLDSRRSDALVPGRGKCRVSKAELACGAHETPDEGALNAIVIGHGRAGVVRRGAVVPAAIRRRGGEVVATEVRVEFDAGTGASDLAGVGAEATDGDERVGGLERVGVEGAAQVRGLPSGTGEALEERGGSTADGVPVVDVQEGVARAVGAFLRSSEIM